jgi:hypothetical protein
VNVGSGRFASDVSYGKGQSGLRAPATGESSVRVDGEAVGREVVPDGGIGREGMEGLRGLPKDAVTREARRKL